MDAISTLLDPLKKDTRIQKHFLGLLHVLIGRRITTSDGQLVSNGLSWRDLAAKLKKLRWDPEAVAELGINAEESAAPRPATILVPGHKPGPGGFRRGACQRSRGGQDS